MASVFDITAFDPSAFQIDQDVEIPVAEILFESIPLRVSAVNAPILNSSDRYLVIGQRIDLANRRVTYIAEQIIFESEVVLALIVDERWEPDFIEPFQLVKDERWELEAEDPNVTVIDERWDMDVSDPGTLVKDERWEG